MDSEIYINIWKTLINKRINEIIICIYRKYGILYSIQQIRETKEYLHDNLEISIIDQNLIQKSKTNKIQKKNVSNTIIISLEERCNARCWVNDNINGKQCSRKRFENSVYCKSHTKNNIHGNFYEPIPEKHRINFNHHQKKQPEILKINIINL